METSHSLEVHVHQMAETINLAYTILPVNILKHDSRVKINLELANTIQTAETVEINVRHED